MLQRLALLAAALLLAGSLLTPARAAEPVEGQDYLLIEPAVDTRSGDRIEVIEVFGYSCIHCARLAPMITDWRKGLADDVKFELVPAVFGGIWEVYGRVFFTAQSMGVLDLTHDELFTAIHDEKRINTVEDLTGFYAEHGLDAEQFMSTMDSFVVTNQVTDARQRVAAFDVDGTPSMIVAGKYRVTAPREGGFKRMLEITDALIARERAARAQ